MKRLFREEVFPYLQACLVDGMSESFPLISSKDIGTEMLNFKLKRQKKAKL